MTKKIETLCTFIVTWRGRIKETAHAFISRFVVCIQYDLLGQRLGVSPADSILHLFQRCSVSLWRVNAALWHHQFPKGPFYWQVFLFVLFCVFCLFCIAFFPYYLLYFSPYSSFPFCSVIQKNPNIERSLKTTSKKYTPSFSYLFYTLAFAGLCPGNHYVHA